MLCSPSALEIIKAVVTIQRRWRIKYQGKFNMYRLMQKNQAVKKRLWKNTIDKYRNTRNL